MIPDLYFIWLCHSLVEGDRGAGLGRIGAEVLRETGEESAGSGIPETAATGRN